MKKYLIKSSAFTLALAMVLGLASCKDDAQVETATDVAAVESASDIVTTTVGTEQTTTVSSTSAQEEITLVTATEPTSAEKSVETAKTTQNTTKKATAKATTTKATVKATQKATTKSTTKKTTTTTKAQGLTDEDVLWAQQKANEYIASLPNVYLNTSLNRDNSSYSSYRGIDERIKTKEKLLERFKNFIDGQLDTIFNVWNYDKIDYYLVVEKDQYGWSYNLLHLNHID